MSININITLEELVARRKISYIEAIVEYADSIDVEIESIAKLLNHSIKDKIELEAQNLNMLKKSARLPL
tara:strand:+ start:229 stop:435 length:207 start_codon:yes stop_codon:yes gene_type:complete